MDFPECKLERKPQPQLVWEELVFDMALKSALELQGVRGDPEIAHVRDEVQIPQVPITEVTSLDSMPELGESGEELPSEELAAQITVNRTVPESVPETSRVTGPTSSATHMQHDSEDIEVLGYSNLLEDPKFNQDAAIEYQSTYYSSKDKYSEQACLLEEASRALQATEDRASQYPKHSKS